LLDYTINTKLNENTPAERLMVKSAGPELLTIVAYQQIKDIYTEKPIPPHFLFF